MPLDVVRQESAARLQEVLSVLSELKQAEPETPVTPEEPHFATKKGLFFVILYASFEYTITRTVHEAVNQVHTSQVKTGHLDRCMYPLALDAEFVSISSPGKDAKWQRRSRLFARQNSDDVVELNGTAVTAELGNIWCKTLQQLFYAFGLTDNSLCEPAVRQYIDEVVENRNKVAHGRESAASVGRSYTVDMLQRRLEEVERQKEYVVSKFENFIDTKLYIKADRRSSYIL